MPRAVRRILGTILLALAALGGVLDAGVSIDPSANPHRHFSSPENCGKCHAVTAGKVDPATLLASSSDLCLSCHSEDELGRLHPWGEKSKPVKNHPRYWKMRVPDDFPLDEDGRIMCLTCHRIHFPFPKSMPHVTKAKATPQQKPENPGAAVAVGLHYKSYFLRRIDSKNGFATLCDACHKYM